MPSQLIILRWRMELQQAKDWMDEAATLSARAASLTEKAMRLIETIGNEIENSFPEIGSSGE